MSAYRRETTAWSRERAAETDAALIEALVEMGAEEAPVRSTYAGLGRASGLSTDGATRGLRRLVAGGRVEVMGPADSDGWPLRLVDANREPLEAVRRASASVRFLAPRAANRRCGKVLPAMLAGGEARPFEQTGAIARRAGISADQARKNLRRHAEAGLVKTLSVGNGRSRNRMHMLTPKGVEAARREAK